MGAPKNFSPNDWLTSAEATEYLGLSHSHLSVLRSRGNGPLYTNVAPEGAAPQYRYRRSDLDNWTASRATTLTPEMQGWIDHAVSTAPRMTRGQLAEVNRILRQGVAA